MSLKSQSPKKNIVAFLYKIVGLAQTEILDKMSKKSLNFLLEYTVIINQKYANFEAKIFL